MRTQYAAQTRPRHRIKQFVKTSFEPATKHREETKPHFLPASHAKPVAPEPVSRQLPLFMEGPLFKAKDFDPL